MYGFAADDEGMVTIHFERFPPGTARKLHPRRTCSFRVLRMINSIIHELNISWDPGISSVFNWDDSTLSDACAFLGLPSTAADLSQRPVPPSPTWFKCDARMPVTRPPR